MSNFMKCAVEAYEDFRMQMREEFFLTINYTIVWEREKRIKCKKCMQKKFIDNGSKKRRGIKIDIDKERSKRDIDWGSKR